MLYISQHNESRDPKREWHFGEIFRMQSQEKSLVEADFEGLFPGFDFGPVFQLCDCESVA